jgi:hypothetical protein|tara:strand:+ start:1162 stop:1383 length:222 start_codon:yes stop_codon:yes gene_type:complete
MKEGNLIGFKVVVNSSGIVMTEMSGVPEEDLHKVFKGDDLQLMRKLLKLCSEKLEPLHSYLELELEALNHPTT